jgi:nucleotide-binding universal stress UspA family protein
VSYQTILVHLDTSERCEERVRLASSLALRVNAHLVGVAATGLAPAMFGDMGDGFSRAANVRSELEMTTVAEEALDRFTERVKGLGLRSYEARLESDEAAAALCLHGRYSDLIVVGQNQPDRSPAAVPASLTADIAELSPRPLLIVPYAGNFDVLGNDIALAWDAGRESARAVTEALPLLKLAKLVRIVTFNAKPSRSGHGPIPGADLALFLARHGVTAEVYREASQIDTGSALLSRVADYGSDLIVMGAYGHSRWRESLLGGVTQTLLEHMTVPVLTAR